MATQRVMKAVACNFLDTYTSRNTSFNRYWLMGFLVGAAEPLEFDLLSRADPADSSPTGVARTLAVSKFRQQLAKHSLDLKRVAEARLRIETLLDSVTASNTPAPRHWLRITLEAAMDSGRRYKAVRTMCLNRHNPRVEAQSLR